MKIDTLLISQFSTDDLQLTWRVSVFGVYIVFLCVVKADNQQFDTSDAIRIEAVDVPDDVLLEDFSSGRSEEL